MPQIVSVATAVPAHSLTQSQLRELAAQHIAEKPHLRRYLSVFDNALVEERHFCVPASWFAGETSVGEANRIYLQRAAELGIEVANACLAHAGVIPNEVDGIVFASSSGIATPSLDTAIANAIGLRRNIQRVPMFGLGCAGGAAALAIASRLTRASPQSRYLVVALELNSLTFQRDDFSPENLVSTALFSDGAAAVLVAGDDAGQDGPLEVVSSVTLRCPDTADLMGWDFGDNGFRVVISNLIPKVVRGLVPEMMEAFAEHLDGDAVQCFILHPGGAKILQAFEEVLGMPSDRFAASYKTLARYGNMSSPTVLFVLEETMRHRPADDKGYGLLGAFGPGFTAEASLLRWRARLAT